MFTLFFACALPAEDAAPERTDAMLKASTTSLTVEVDGDDGASVALVQYTFSGSSYTEYDTYAESTVSGGRATFSLATTPASSVLTPEGGTRAHFAVLLLDENGEVIGITPDVIGWYASAPSGASRAGWLVGRDELFSTATAYEVLGRGVDIEDNLLGDDSFEFTGTASGLSSTARASAEPSDTDAEAPGDWALASRWSIEISGEPDSDALESGSHLEIGFFPLEVYDDTNHNGAWDRTTETDLGDICHGNSAVALRWVSPVYDLAGAYAMYYHDLQAGWSVGTLSGEALSGIQARNYRVREDC